jgi:hypothetical protein
MTLNYLPQHLERFLFTLTVVSKEAVLLAETRKRLFAGTTRIVYNKRITSGNYKDCI